MKILKTILKISAIGLLCTAALSAQSIRLVRTDVDTTRDHFVTATFMFGVDVVVDSASKVNGVAFELRHNLAESIRFSGWEPRSFTSKNTIVIDQTNPATGVGSISIGILNGKNSNQPGSDNPSVIHLNFVVAPDAVHNSNLTFTFVNPQAVIGGDSSRIVNLVTTPLVYNVHSFVNVWPGDTDNNGVVDTRDVSQIGVFVGAGSSESNVRGFKRQQPSALWIAQPALAWDSTEITYADADGNGAITARDMLVVLANFGKSRQSTIIANNSPEKNSSKEKNSLLKKEIFSSEYERIPVRVSSAQTTLGISGNISLAELERDFTVYGIEAGEIFSRSENFVWYDKNDSQKNLEFVIGTTSRAEIPANGVAAYLVVERKNLSAHALIRASELSGVSTDGRIFTLENVSAVEENFSPEEILFRQNFSSLMITSNSGEEIFLSVTNSLGEEIFPSSKILPNSTKEIFLSELPSGAYFLVLRSGKKSSVHPFAVAR